MAMVMMVMCLGIVLRVVWHTFKQKNKRYEGRGRQTGVQGKADALNSSHGDHNRERPPSNNTTTNAEIEIPTSMKNQGPTEHVQDHCNNEKTKPLTTTKVPPQTGRFVSARSGT
jgi:hypothetical protein